MARTPEQEQKRRRRKRLIRGLLAGGAAIGLPALVNAVVARRASRLKGPRWGRGERFAWAHGDIAFQRLGAGLPLVLLHSFGPGHSAVEWRAAAEILSRDHLIFAPDFLGWGESDKPPLEYTGQLYIEQIVDFLQDVVKEPAVLVGAGWSAAYAIQVAADHTTTARGLALVVPSGINAPSGERDLRDLTVHRLLRLPVLGTSALNVFTSRKGLRSYLQREVFAKPERVDEALLEEHYRKSHLPGAHAALASYLAGYLNHRVRRVSSRLRSPVWIVWGREATSPEVASADLWLRALPHAELEVLEGTGSLPHAEAPEAFCRVLQGFLSTLTD